MIPHYLLRLIIYRFPFRPQILQIQVLQAMNCVPSLDLHLKLFFSVKYCKDSAFIKYLPGFQKQIILIIKSGDEIFWNCFFPSTIYYSIV